MAADVAETWFSAAVWRTEIIYSSSVMRIKTVTVNFYVISKVHDMPLKMYQHFSVSAHDFISGIPVVYLVC